MIGAASDNWPEDALAAGMGPGTATPQGDFGTYALSHLVGRIGWLHAAILSANDRIISIANLIVGVAAAAASMSAQFVAGTTSMTASEYVSIGS